MDKAIQNDNDAETSDALRNTKQSVISELLYQTKKIEAAKEKSSTTTDKLSNFQNKKPRKSTTSAERKKKSCAIPEETEAEKLANKGYG